MLERRERQYFLLPDNLDNMLDLNIWVIEVGLSCFVSLIA